jgi:amino acid transporter
VAADPLEGLHGMEISGHQPAKLRRELNVWEAIGISLALMAPSMAANINPQGTAGLIGRAVPLGFAMATVGVLLVAYGFVRLTQQFHHAGSVYGFVGVTLGPRAGVFSGWGLMGTYIFYACVTSMAAGIFGASFLQSLGVIPQGDIDPLIPLLLGLVAMAGAWFLALVPARDGTRILLTVEGITVALILILTVVIFAQLASGTAPEGRKLDWSVFSVPDGTDLSAVALGAVFGFLSFAGFEAAATLGEEAKNPRKDIPRAILGVAVFGGIYFIVVTAVEVMGFGTDDAGIKAFTSSGSLLGDLGSKYIGAWIGDLITIGAAVSAFGCCLACLVGASRLLFALSRDNQEVKGLGFPARVSTRWGTPYGALAIVALFAFVIILLWHFVLGAGAFDIFLGSGTIGTLILLVAYLFATVGAIKLLFFSGKPKVAFWEIIIPILGLLVLGYTLFRNVWPYPDGGTAAFYYPIVTVAWLLAGAIIILVMSGMARRVGQRLEADEGLIAASS